MSNQDELVASLTALESDIGRYGIPSSAIIHPDAQNLADDARAVFAVIEKMGRTLKVRVNEFDQYKLDASNYVVETNRLCGDIRINTRVGKFVMPAGTKVAIVGRH